MGSKIYSANLRVEVRGRLRSGDGTIKRVTKLAYWVLLDGDAEPSLFKHESVKAIRYVGQRVPWDENKG